MQRRPFLRAPSKVRNFGFRNLGNWAKMAYGHTERAADPRPTRLVSDASLLGGLDRSARVCAAPRALVAALAPRPLGTRPPPARTALIGGPRGRLLRQEEALLVPSCSNPMARLTPVMSRTRRTESLAP